VGLGMLQQLANYTTASTVIETLSRVMHFWGRWSSTRFLQRLGLLTTRSRPGSTNERQGCSWRRIGPAAPQQRAGRRASTLDALAPRTGVTSRAGIESRLHAWCPVRRTTPSIEEPNQA